MSSMNFNLPIPDQTTGPEWAQQLNNQLETVVAEHDHTSGKGVQLTQESLNITNDLTLNDNDLRSARTVNFTPKDTVPGNVDDINALCSVAGELVYIDGNGTAVPITANGSIDVGSVNGITGLQPPAVAGYANSIFTFKDTATTYANMEHGPIRLYSDQTSPSNAVVIKSPNNLAAEYDIILPTANPAATSFVTLANNGQLAATIPTSLGINTANITNNAITPAKMATLTRERIVVDNVTMYGVYNQWVNVGNALSIIGTGRPIYVALQPNVTSTVTSGKAGIHYWNTLGILNCWSFRVSVTQTAVPTGFYGVQSWQFIGQNYTNVRPGIIPAQYCVVLPGYVGTVGIQFQVRNDNNESPSAEVQTIYGCEFIAFQL